MSKKAAQEAKPDHGDTSDLAGQMEERGRTIATLREKGVNPYANDFRITCSHDYYFPCTEIGLPFPSFRLLILFPNVREVKHVCDRGWSPVTLVFFTEIFSLK